MIEEVQIFLSFLLYLGSKSSTNFIFVFCTCKWNFIVVFRQKYDYFRALARSRKEKKNSVRRIIRGSNYERSDRRQRARCFPRSDGGFGLSVVAAQTDQIRSVKNGEI